jgi:hypothetical protein
MHVFPVGHAVDVYAWPVLSQVATMPASHVFAPGSHLLQSPPLASHVPPSHGVVLVIAVPSALQITRELPSHEGLTGSQTASVHLPSILLHRPAVLQSSCVMKLMPSASQTSSDASVHLNSSRGKHNAHI